MPVGPSASLQVTVAMPVEPVSGTDRDESLHTAVLGMRAWGNALPDGTAVI